MRKPVLIIEPICKSGSPVSERIKAYKSFLTNYSIDFETIRTPESIFELFCLIKCIYIKKFEFLLLSMPPFKNWILCFLPGVKVILDIRDGWSIAMKLGYGNTVKKRPYRMWLARLIERYSIKSSALTVTVTYGLQDYLKKISGQSNVLFVPNGYAQSDQEWVKKFKSKRSDMSAVRYICAGKFTEYGRKKAEKIIQEIKNRHPNEVVNVDLYGLDKQKNVWLKNWGSETLNITLYDHYPREELLKEICKADYGIVAVRDETYEYGTKIFDYIMCKIPLFTIIDLKIKNVEYFWDIFLNPDDPEIVRQYSREFQFEKNKDSFLCLLKEGK
jgi:hypothetical protein